MAQTTPAALETARTVVGKALGFHLVQAYLRKTGKTAAEATLIPSAEIVRVADFF